jgi:hypothetical protein
MPTKPKKHKYQEYINSDGWRSKHPEWLKQAKHRCQLTGFPVGKSGGKYHGYAIHHLHYNSLGKEEYWRDVLPVTHFAHWLIHQVLGGHAKASKQRAPFPNAAQRFCHCWMRVPLQIRDALVGVVAIALAFVALGIFW